MIEENLTEIRGKISLAAARAGRKADDVRILAAAKGQSREKVELAVAAGIRIIGHNYVQEAAKDVSGIQCPGLEFHMIGHLQKNKAAKASDLFHVIQTVDDVKLAEILQRRAESLKRTIGVMIQVNLAHEIQKSGINSDEVADVALAIRSLPNLRLLGLMTMPPFFDDPEAARPYFAQLRGLRDRLMASAVLAADMTELSMGMTGDYEVAVEEGATIVRIGTALFGPRD